MKPSDINMTPGDINLTHQVELERNQARLATLKKVRPAFMDEYEKLEAEMKKCYEEYMVNFEEFIWLVMLIVVMVLMKKCYEEYMVICMAIFCSCQVFWPSVDLKVNVLKLNISSSDEVPMCLLTVLIVMTLL